MTTLVGVGRWEADAKGRLREAAWALFAERGFEQVTVAEIGERAGLTGRTFFRHFTDKRELLFDGSGVLQERMVAALAGAPAGATAIEAVAAALAEGATILGRDQAFATERQKIIMANAELLERELIKLATLSAALAAGLRDRGVPEPDASLAGESAIVVLRVAFERWLSAPAGTDLGALMTESLHRLRSVVS
jgi:AcrR family transcriptional regulator